MAATTKKGGKKADAPGNKEICPLPTILFMQLKYFLVVSRKR